MSTLDKGCIVVIGAITNIGVKETVADAFVSIQHYMRTVAELINQSSSSNLYFGNVQAHAHRVS